MSKVKLINNYNNEERTVPVGFSWTTFLFGCFPSLFRKDWKFTGIQFALAVFTNGLSWLVMPFIYNKLHIKELINKGFEPINENDAETLILKGIIKKEQMEYIKNRLI